MGSGNDELCSDTTYGVESSTGGGVNDDARSPGVCKVGLVVSWITTRKNAILDIYYLDL